MGTVKPCRNCMYYKIYNVSIPYTIYSSYSVHDGLGTPVWGDSSFAVTI